MNVSAHWLSLFFLVFLVNCKPVTSTDDIPSYIHIPSVSFTTEPVSEGANTHGITDSWIYVNDNLAGVFEVPVTLPLIFRGEQKLTVLAGVKENGISSTRNPYPFYTPYIINKNLSPALADTVFPTFNYESRVVFPIIESFELGNAFNNISRITDNDIVAYGSAAGKIDLPDTLDFVVAQTIDWFILPTDGEQVWVELDYKNNHTFMVGLQAQKGTEEGSVLKLTINPRENWNKIYINITPEVSGLNADRYKLYLAVNRSTGTNPLIYIDNVKIVHFD